MNKDEWIERCKAHFAALVKDMPDGWDDIAESCWEELYEDYPDDPEGAANEEMLCWTNDTDIDEE